MTRLSLFILSTLLSLAISDPQVLYLSKFKVGFTTFVDNIETGAQLYLASNAKSDVLKNIKITTGATTITLDKISDTNADGTPKSIPINGGLSIKTTNNDTVTNKLTGYIYVTTREQADDPTFSVYVIKNMHSVSVTGMKSTVVVLNTQLKDETVDFDQPPKTSYVTSIHQSPNTDLYFHWGFPSADWHNVSENQFFENPLYLNNYDEKGTYYNTTKAFFDNVEPLQINLEYWYFTVSGPINMFIENKYVSNHNYTTTAVNTTGLIVNDLIFLQHVVNFQLDLTRSGTAGTLISTFPSSENYISFILYGNNGGGIEQNYNSITNVKHALMTTYMQATKLIVNSTSIVPGTFYCQYYGFAGDLLPPTTSTDMPTTTTKSTTSVVSTSTVLTTTKSSRSQSIIELIVMMFVFIILR